MSGNLGVIENDIKNKLQKGLVTHALISLKELIDSGNSKLSSSFLAEVLRLLYTHRDQIVRQKSLLVSVIENVQKITKLLDKSTIRNESLFLSKFLVGFHKSVSKEGFLEESIILLRCLLNELNNFEKYCSNKDSTKETTEIYGSLYPSLYNLAIKVDDNDASLKGEVLKLRILSAVFCLKGQLYAEHLPTVTSTIFERHYCKELTGENGFTAIEDVIINLVDSSDVSLLISTGISYFNWIVGSGCSAGDWIAVDRSFVLFKQLIKSILQFQLNNKATNFISAFNVLVNFLSKYASSDKNVGTQKSPVRLFLSNRVRSSDKENADPDCSAVLPQRLIDFVLDSSPGKHGVKRKNKNTCRTFGFDDVNSFFNELSSLYKSLTTEKFVSEFNDVLLSFVNFCFILTEEMKEKPIEEKIKWIKLQNQLHGFIIELITEQLQNNVSNEIRIAHFELKYLSQWKKKLRVCADLITDMPAMNDNLLLEVSEMIDMVTSPSFNGTFDGIIPIVTECYKIGKYYYTSSSYKQAIDWLEPGLKLYAAYASGTTTNSSLKLNFKIWPCYEILAECRRKLGQRKEAYQAVVEGLCMDSLSLSQAAFRWMKITADMLADKQQPKYLTMSSALKKHLKVQSTLTVEMISLAELGALKESRVYLYAYHDAVLNDLLSLYKNDLPRKCKFLLEKSKLVRSTGEKSCIEASAKIYDEVIDLLETSCKEGSLVAKDLKAQALVLKFVVADPENNDELDLDARLKKIEILKTSDNVDNNERVVVGDNGTESKQTAEEIESELESLQSSSFASLDQLETALDIWIDIFQEKTEPGNIVEDICSTKETIEILACIFKLHQHPRGPAALQLLFNLSTSTDDISAVLLTSTLFIDYLVEVNQCHMASQVITDVDDFLAAKSKDSIVKHRSMYCQYLISKSHALLLENKLKESLDLMIEVGKLCVDESNDALEDNFLKSHMYLLISKFCSSERDRDVIEAIGSLTFLNDECGKRKTLGTQLEWLTKCTRHFTALLFHLFRKKKFALCERPSMKWIYVDRLITSILHTTRLYIRGGILRESKIHLLNALAYAQSFHVKKRICEVKLEMAHFAKLSCFHDDCRWHLATVSSLLNDHKTGSDPVKERNEDKRGKPRGTRSAVSDSKIPIRGDDPEDVAPATTTDFQFSYVPLRLSFNDDTSVSPTSPGKKLPEKFILPTCWEENCRDNVSENCPSCRDITMRRLQLRKIIEECELRLSIGQSWDYVNDFLNKYEDFKDHLVRWAERDLNKQARWEYRCVSKSTGSKKSDLKETNRKNHSNKKFNGKLIFSDLFIRVEIIRMKIDFLRNSLTQSKSSAIKEIYSKECPKLESCLLAEMKFLEFVDKLGWPSRTNRYLSEIDLLCACVGRLTTADDDLQNWSIRSEQSQANIFSPAPKGGKTFAAPNAPIKQGRKPPKSSLKLELPRSSAQSSAKKKRKPPRLDEIDPNLADDLNKVMAQKTFTAIGDCNLLDSLFSSFELIRRDPPAVQYRDLCHSLALLNLQDQSTDDNVAAYYLSEAVSISFRHASLINISKKIRNGMENSQTTEYLEIQRNFSDFTMTQDNFAKLMNNLPENWTICQLNLVSLAGKDRNQLFVTRMTRKQPAFVLPLPHMTAVERKELLNKWTWLMKENENTMKVTERKDWWTRRKKLDDDIESLLDDLEKEWFSGWVGSLMGKLLNENDEAVLEDGVNTFLKNCPLVSPKQRRMVEVLLSGSHLLENRHILQALACMIDQPLADHGTLRQFIPLVKSISNKMNLSIASRGPVILILDKDIQHLPLENMPGLKTQSFTRQLSLHCMMGQVNCFLWKDNNSVLRSGVDRDSVFYVVNPDNNLSHTQTTFQVWFKKKELKWEGVIGKPPTSEELSSHLMNKDLFIYVGHGTGGKYLTGGSLQMLHCRSAVILMGCSSGKLTIEGQFEPHGMIFHYFLAGSPCILANLWDVTDKDIDRYTGAVLKNWLHSYDDESIPQSDLSSNVNFVTNAIESRAACTLRYLTGAAPVVYGFPISLSNDSSVPDRLIHLPGN